MGVTTTISDYEKKRFAKVDSDGAIIVKAIPIPTISDRDESLPFSDYLKDDAGSFNMLADGSAMPVDFFVTSAESADEGVTGDRYITSLSFSIQASNAKLADFGNSAALVNGIDVVYISRFGERVINGFGGIKTNFQLIRFCQGQPAFGDSADAFRVSSAGGGATHGYIPVLNFQIAFAQSFGLRIRSGTNQMLAVRIKDNLIGTAAEFNAVVSGFDLLETL